MRCANSSFSADEKPFRGDAGKKNGRAIMAISLNHTIVPARDKEASARFFAQIFGLKYNGPMSHFAPVQVNGELTLDFDNADSFERHHYAFHVSDEEFDAIFKRVQEAGIPWAN
jgi:catechol 2,3-dioxygenase-like lactoylglutathione lyase family enzyme